MIVARKKCLDVGDVPKINECSGSGGDSNAGNFTLPLIQHMPAVSPGKLAAAQCRHLSVIPPIRPCSL